MFSGKVFPLASVFAAFSLALPCHQVVAQSSKPEKSDLSGSGLIAYTLRAWKTDEFDLSEVGKIVESMPFIRSGKLKGAEAEEILDRGLKLMTQAGGVDSGIGETQLTRDDSQTQISQKTQRFSQYIQQVLRSGKVKLQIFTRNLDGSDKRQLTFEGDNGRPDWSPDGKKITFGAIRDGKRWAAVMDADGSNQELLAEGGSPDWSPDGKQIAYARDGQVWVMKADGTEKTQITHSPTRKSGPSWSSDGKEMVFIMRPEGVAPGDPGREIGIMNADGTNERVLTREDRVNVRIEPDGSKTILETAYDANAPAWSPVDNRIAMWSGIETKYGQVWVINSDGTGSTQLTENPLHRNNDDPSWSPDGKKIIFSTGRSGRNEIWIVDQDGSNERFLFPIDASPFPGRPAWQPMAPSQQ